MSRLFLFLTKLHFISQRKSIFFSENMVEYGQKGLMNLWQKNSKQRKMRFLSVLREK